MASGSVKEVLDGLQHIASSILKFWAKEGTKIKPSKYLQHSIKL